MGCMIGLSSRVCGLVMGVAACWHAAPAIAHYLAAALDAALGLFVGVSVSKQWTVAVLLAQAMVAAVLASAAVLRFAQVSHSQQWCADALASCSPFSCTNCHTRGADANCIRKTTHRHDGFLFNVVWKPQAAVSDLPKLSPGFGCLVHPFQSACFWNLLAGCQGQSQDALDSPRAQL